jgi:hypothetical protein
MKIELVQTNFTSGELSPRIYGRTDITKYYNGFKKAINFIVLAQGGLSKRPGTKFIAETKFSNRKVRLIPFKFSTEQNYILEFGHNYVRVFKDEGQVLSSGAPYEISSPYVEEDLSELYWTQSADILFLCHKKYPPKNSAELVILILLSLM